MEWTQEILNKMIEEALDKRMRDCPPKNIARWGYDGSRSVRVQSNLRHTNNGAGSGIIDYEYERKDYICSHCRCLSHRKSKFCPDCGYFMDNAE